MPFIPHLNAQSAVVSLQNGVNEPGIAKRIGSERVIGCLVDFSSDYYAPGLVVLGRAGNLFIGELDGRVSRRLEEVRRLLSLSTRTNISSNIMGCVWAKMCKASVDITTALVDAGASEERSTRQRTESESN